MWTTQKSMDIAVTYGKYWTRSTHHTRPSGVWPSCSSLPPMGRWTLSAVVPSSTKPIDLKKIETTGISSSDIRRCTKWSNLYNMCIKPIAHAILRIFTRLNTYNMAEYSGPSILKPPIDFALSKSIQVNLSWETTVRRGRLEGPLAYKMAESPTFQCNWICHLTCQSPPALRDHNFMVNPVNRGEEVLSFRTVSTVADVRYF